MLRTRRSNPESSIRKLVSGKPPTRSQTSLRNAMERAVQDFVGASAVREIPKKGADATSQMVRPIGSIQDPPSAYSALPARIGAVKFASHSGEYAQPASAHAMTSDDACAIATFRPRPIGPGDPCKLQLSSRIGFRPGHRDFAACNLSHVPSAEPPSTMMISVGTSVWPVRLSTRASISATSFRTVEMTLTAAIVRRYSFLNAGAGLAAASALAALGSAAACPAAPEW